MGALLIAVGVIQSANVALAIFNLCLISAIMTLGVNIQWGYAGLFNAGVMGFAALGGLAAVLVSFPPVPEAWAVGGFRAMLGVVTGAISIFLGIIAFRKFPGSRRIRGWGAAGVALSGIVLMRFVLDPAVEVIEAVEPARTGFLGGLRVADCIFLDRRWSICGIGGLGNWENCARFAVRLSGHRDPRYLRDHYLLS